jgi:hypothetical protein
MNIQRPFSVVILLLVVMLAGCGGRAGEAPALLTGGSHEVDGGAGKGSGLPAGEETVARALPTATGGGPPTAEEPVEAVASFGEGGASETASAPHRSDVRQQASLRAGEVDDNEEWDDYLLYRRNYGRSDVHDVDVSERYVITVVDSAGRPVHGALVAVFGDGRDPLFEAVADAGGRVLFHPSAFPASQGAESFRVSALDPALPSEEAVAEFPREPSLGWQVVLPGEQVQTAVQLDLLFLLDATGSMGDEIDALKSTILEISAQIDALEQRPDVRYGLVTYRDRGDVYVTRVHGFTQDVIDFQRTLSAVTASGGDDYPESLNEALHDALHGVEWRESKTVRLIFLVADAPPHLDYSQDYDYAEEMIIAAGRGAKIFPIASSGLDDQGEYIYRQIAQFTGGKFIFLTYAADGSGPGDETDHHVEEYTVQNLDALVVRLVEEELAKLSR